MKDYRIHAVFFSPCRSTGKIVKYIAGGLSREASKDKESMTSHEASGYSNSASPVSSTVNVIDFTLPSSRETIYTFGPKDLVVFGCPTYAGKTPNKILHFLQTGFKGNGAPVIPIVTFGNRSFDNSLAELTESLKDSEFKVIAAGAFCCRHAFTNKLGTGRPDKKDYDDMDLLISGIINKMQDFFKRFSSPNNLSKSDSLDQHIADNLLISLKQIPGSFDAPYYTPLGTDGKPAVFLKAKPITNNNLCDDCGFCVKVCPMGAINPSDFSDVPGTCIKCHACVNLCHKGAKSFHDPAFISHRTMLEENYAETRAENCIFL